MDDDPWSGTCEEREETNLHAIRDCGEARKVWKFIIPEHEVLFDANSAVDRVEYCWKRDAPLRSKLGNMFRHWMLVDMAVEKRSSV